MFEFKLPDLGEGIHEGELLHWHVSVGDRINEDDPLCDIETDKAAVTIPSPRAGVIDALNGRPGETIAVGHVFVVIEDGRSPSVDLKSASIEKGMEPPDTAVTAGSVKPEHRVTEPKDQHPGKARPVIAAPATRRMAREMGIDIQMVPGSGPAGRVTPEDLERFEPATAESKQPPNENTPAGTPVSEPGDGRVGVPVFHDDAQGFGIPFFEVQGHALADHGPVERLPLRSLRKKTAIKTTSSSILIPHVAHMDEIDVSEIETDRETYNARHGKDGKLTLMAFVIKAVVAGLKDYPMFNASIDLSSSEIVHKKFFHIGFAADTPRGLMVPVIRDADQLSLDGLGRRIRHLTGRARNGEITVEELTRGTFTITNVGSIGGTYVFPIINAPESAILGLGRVDQKPVVKDGQIVVRSMLPVTLCFDHRVADGAQAASFIKSIRRMLEDRLTFMGRS